MLGCLPACPWAGYTCGVRIAGDAAAGDERVCVPRSQYGCGHDVWSGGGNGARRMAATRQLSCLFYTPSSSARSPVVRLLRSFLLPLSAPGWTQADASFSCFQHDSMRVLPIYHTRPPARPRIPLFLPCLPPLRASAEFSGFLFLSLMLFCS
ncbi:hypothetical protein B0H11DRAFT_1975014, partial [Mycena galericulata]